ncbi:PIN-like domain-containing protein [Paeniglutamicibacter sp. ZC-3]|uniref:PIN-like domain-containing protein n=1 Tax=Paeniglutamicibacter sp. ZC-3 TaxID=2986919 RepID=UPI0021F6F889|nr:PIN-like domain-containing protein [Paeniglutamicibacter sp. ZC-3]MCV9994257.1 PIN-like domain-containing protein [Paeniglutamicibacter sp. ZC-3]
MSESAVNPNLDTVIDCVSRNIGELNWIDPVRLHTENKIPKEWSAIGFDTNALKQLRRFPSDKRTSILTYLQSKTVPMILPAQAIQEYWNNHGIFTKDVQNLENDTKKLAVRYGKLTTNSASRSKLETMAAQVASLADDVADSQNPHLLKESVDLWNSLLPDAIVSHVPREKIFAIGESRFASGIAPGFADDSKKANRLGDFYVWSDFLLGLKNLNLNVDDKIKSTVVFVTDDAKEDWMTSQIPHPTLLGEVFLLTGRPLLILRMEQLQNIVAG